MPINLWTKKEIAILKRLTRQGKSVEDIATAVNRTAHAVSVKKNRLAQEKKSAKVAAPVAIKAKSVTLKKGAVVRLPIKSMKVENNELVIQL